LESIFSVFSLTFYSCDGLGLLKHNVANNLTFFREQRERKIGQVDLPCYANLLGISTAQ
jgi:hypothetical protein